MEAINFLKNFKHKTYTLAYFNGKAMRSFPCKEENLEKAFNLLKDKNKDQEIYFMVNEGNGQWNENKTACHRTENVTHLSAFFLDAELLAGDPLPTVISFCEDFFYQPTSIIQTSENRYHIYWVFDKPIEITPEYILKWKQVQAFIHNSLSIDRTMTDLPQVLRIPDFNNIKKKCKVSIVSSTTDTYDFDTLYNKLVSKFPEISKYSTHTPLQTLEEDYKIPEGERHEELMRRCRKLYTLPLTDLEIKYTLDGIIKNHVNNNADFLPGGKRRKEIERILSSCKGYAEEQRQKELTDSIAKHTEFKKSKTPFELDPDFYYNAPSIVGELTRHFVDTSQTPIPAHAFAAAVSLTGFTKARFIQGQGKLPPINYFLCLAPSGSGKTTIQHSLKQVCKDLNISHLIEDGIASAQGLIQFISESKNLGFVIYDEVKDLFQTISSKFAASYEVKISTELTKLYTAYKSTYTPPTTKTHKGKKIVLDKPLLSFIGYGQHVLIDQLFSKSNVSDGLLPRFIILNVNEKTEKTPINKSLPQNILNYLQENLTKSCIALEEKTESTEIPVDCSPIVKTLLFSPEAQLIFNSFDLKRNSLYNQAITDRNGLEALFSRGSEQVIRLCLAMSDGQISPQIAEFCTTLVNSQMQNFYSQFSKSVNQTVMSKEIEDLLNTITELCAESKDYTISKRDLNRKVQHRYKNSKTFHEYITWLVQCERIAEFEMTLPSGKKQTRIKLDDIT